MDFGTLLGVLAGVGVVSVAVLIGGDARAFVNVSGIIIVLGGTTAATLIKFSLSDVAKALKIGLVSAFSNPKSDPRYIYDLAIELAARVRKGGLLVLENVEVNNALFRHGLRLCADGHSIEIIKEAITREVDLSIQQSEIGELMFRGIGESAPAFGMIGTLVGLVQMLASISDPGSIGPAMAVAMLTTFYGALIANLLALPIADKLARRAEQDRITKNLIVDSVVQIHKGQNPRVMAELLGVYLPGGALQNSRT